MKRQLIILGSIIFGILLSSFLFCLESHNLFWGTLFLPFLFLIIPASVLAFLISSSIPKYKSNLLKLLIWTNSIGLAIAISFFLLGFGSDLYYDNYQANINNNKPYKNYFSHSNDSLVVLAISAIEKKQKKLNDYGIYYMRIIEGDTLHNGVNVPCYMVYQIYFLGKRFNEDNAYVSKHIIYTDKTIQEIYDKALLTDSTGSIELQRRKHFMNDAETTIESSYKNNKESNQSFKEGDFAIEVIKE